MLFFPQLATGASCQYPFAKSRRVRTIQSASPSGTVVKMPDELAGYVEWDLQFRGLSDAEAASIQALFDSTGGRYKEFAFLDPSDNLLQWSEDFDHPVWERNALLVLTTGRPDGAGGSGATRIANISQAALRIEQRIDAPAWYEYAFSIFLRSDDPKAVRLTRSATDETQIAECLASTDWRRCVLAGHLTSSNESVRFGVEIPAGTALDIFACQVEGQPGASPYHRTRSRSGLYRRCRFGSDSLRITTQGQNDHGCRVLLRAAVTN